MKFYKKLLISLGFFLSLNSKAISGACSLVKNPPGFSSIVLQNENVFSGWFEAANNTNYPVRLVNAKNPLLYYTLEPYERKSFNFKGLQEVLCYRPRSEISLDRQTDIQVNCHEVLNISKCYDMGEDNRYPDLGLV
jgi:hypothetical protein